MSIFSGKCDFFDSFCMIAGEGNEDLIKKNLKKTTIYIIGDGNREHKIRCDTIKDIAMYYPYIPAISHGNKEFGYVYVLGSRPYIDRCEDESKQLRINPVMRYWRKCKRKKIPYTAEECIKDIAWKNDEILIEVAKRVEKDGDKADFRDIHTWMCEYYRREWFKELVRVGYAERQAYDWAFDSIYDKPEVVKKRLGEELYKEESYELLL